LTGLSHDFLTVDRKIKQTERIQNPFGHIQQFVVFTMCRVGLLGHLCPVLDEIFGGLVVSKVFFSNVGKLIKLFLKAVKKDKLVRQAY
jgi:hypothetical protein